MNIDPLQIQLISMGVTFFVSSLLSFFVFLNNRKDPVAAAFGVAMIFFSIWALFGFLAHLSGGNWAIGRVMKIISVIFIPVLTVGINRFAVIFYNHAFHTVRKIHYIILYVLYATATALGTLLISDLYGFSGYIVAKDPGLLAALAPAPGPFLVFVIAHFIVGALFTIYLFFATRKSESQQVKSQSNWILVSVVVGLFAGGTRFAAWYDSPLSALSILIAPAVITGIFYAITKYKLFNVKVDKVRISIRKPKMRMANRRPIKGVYEKKAIVTLKEGYAIDVLGQNGTDVVAADHVQAAPVKE